MNKAKIPKRKKLYLVNRDFQLRYTGVAVIVGLVSTTLTILLILFPLYQFEILRIPRFLPWPILLLMVLAAFANIMLVGVLGIFITHKIAGPMYSLVREFRKVEEGIWSGEMRQREGDDMRYVVRNFNGMLHSLRDQVQGDLEAVEAAIAFAKEDDKGQSLTELENLKERLAARLGPQPSLEVK